MTANSGIPGNSAIPGTLYLIDAPPAGPWHRPMARLARVVVPDVAHHVTQRGNRRQPVFFGDEDYAACRDLVAAACRA